VPAGPPAGNAEIFVARLRGREGERLGVCPAVVLGQDLAGLAGLVRELDLLMTSYDASPPDRLSPRRVLGARYAA
jgi:hypothetical protein